MINDDDSKYACDEYLDALVTVELAAAFAIKERRPVNRAIRSCWHAIRWRVTNKTNRQILDGVAMQFMPHGALCMLRRQLDSAVSEA